MAVSAPARLAEGLAPARDHEASYYQVLPGQRVLCTLCPHGCRISEGLKGACGVRVNHRGRLYTLVYDKVVARNVEPIEKKPLFHFLPGSLAYSIATVGCNLRCSFCQNWHIAEWPKDHLPRRLGPDADPEPHGVCPQLATLERAIPGERVTPGEIVSAALASGSASIAYTFTEPTVFFELAYDTALLAQEQGLRNVFVTNGFISEEPLRQLSRVLDAANIDLKFFREASYRRISRARLAPVLESIRLYRQLGIWVEVTTLVIPGLNDSDQELGGIAEFVRSLGAEVPWHVSQFYPAHRMRDRPHTPVPTLRRARQIGLDAGLRYVYEGNVPGEGGESTYCPGCGALLVERYGFLVRANRIEDASCPECGVRIDGVEMTGPPAAAPVGAV